MAVAGHRAIGPATVLMHPRTQIGAGGRHLGRRLPAHRAHQDLATALGRPALQPVERGALGGQRRPGAARPGHRGGGERRGPPPEGHRGGHRRTVSPGTPGPPLLECPDGVRGLPGDPRGRHHRAVGQRARRRRPGSWRGPDRRRVVGGQLQRRHGHGARATGWPRPHRSSPGSTWPARSPPARTRSCRSAPRCWCTATTWAWPATGASPSGPGCRPAGWCPCRPTSTPAGPWSSARPASPPCSRSAGSRPSDSNPVRARCW